MRGEAKRLSEGATDKCLVALRCLRELKYKVIQKFGGGGKSISDAFLEASQFATQDVVLSKAAYDAIAREIAEAYQERLKRRVIRDIRNGKASPSRLMPQAS